MDDQSETYTVQEAARVLKHTPEAIGLCFLAGSSRTSTRTVTSASLGGFTSGAPTCCGTVCERTVPQRTRARPQEPNERPREPAVAPPNRFGLRDLRREVQRLEHRLELSERTESALREELAREHRLVEEERMQDAATAALEAAFC